ncbi:hypothetical protein RCG42_07615 [Lactobacillus delbrueckii subsp. lactis]|uniref:hypothetical protein n=1 Tax=Lactobacillus delbrueckii TaxID=1584 RepID=UPI0027F25BAA|nr:hypothetical protein [Lactobacillus delbrueckii]MDQ7161230.1 hypothetical protein [Lactobacillus delbrueckii subsp. lactis]MDQ7163769.1 hypothetical protein [Lactobacillus delbrueckii subsp. lactis]MDQ7177305.1 hypothetical protein [Lactobacillus delbrueckii subsp. lactis]MDQ7206876.1 hypothetical protein [Lactobacillus delbrueckii subsp. lactis]
MQKQAAFLFFTASRDGLVDRVLVAAVIDDIDVKVFPEVSTSDKEAVQLPGLLVEGAPEGSFFLPA